MRLSKGEIWSATSWHSKRKPSNRSSATRQQMDSKIMLMGSRSKKGKKKRMRRRTFTS